MFAANFPDIRIVMLTERTIETTLSLALGGFAAVWIGLIVSAAAAIPIVGFVAAIPAALVVYALRASLTGSQRAKIDRRLT